MSQKLQINHLHHHLKQCQHALHTIHLSPFLDKTWKARSDRELGTKVMKRFGINF